MFVEKVKYLSTEIGITILRVVKEILVYILLR